MFLITRDDFGGAELRKERADESFDSLGEILEDVGVEESKKKAVSPTTLMEYLGIEFDTIKMEMRVSQVKLQELKQDLSSWKKKKVASKQELQSLLGKLMWVSKCVKFSRVFVSRIIALVRTLKAQRDKAKMVYDIKKDILWWDTFIEQFNGIEYMTDENIDISIYGDAQPTGGGAWNPDTRECFTVPFPAHMASSDVPIHVKEFWIVIVSIRLWGDKWMGRTIQIFCDNDAVVDVINYQKPKDIVMQELLREFLFLVCNYKFAPILSKIKSKENDVADYLSRNQDQEDNRRYFEKKNLDLPEFKTIPDNWFEYSADW